MLISYPCPLLCPTYDPASRGAQPGFVDRNDLPPPRRAAGHALRQMIVDQIALVLKLAFFMFYFGAHISGWRYGCLILLCVLTFVYQGGWIEAQPDRAVVAADADNNDVAAAAADADADAGGGGNDEAGVDIAAAGDVGDGEAMAEGQDDDAEAAADRIEAAAVLAAETDDVLLVPVAPVAPVVAPSLTQLVSNIFLKFFESMIPGRGAVPAVP